MSDRFQVRWEADDGYAGGSRPHSFTLRESELDADMSEEDVRAQLEATLEDDFRDKIRPYLSNEDEAVAWAMERIASMREDDSPAPSGGAR